MKISGSIPCKTYWFKSGSQERTSFMENEYGEIGKDVENKDFYTIVISKDT